MVISKITLKPVATYEKETTTTAATTKNPNGGS